MLDSIKITFTGGDGIGDEVERPLLTKVLIGRSHAADIRVKEADVSGKHLEIVRRAEGCFARNLSRYPATVDGAVLQTGEEAPVRRKSLIELGRRLRIRIDALPTSAAANDSSTATGAETGVTMFGGSGETMATAFVDASEISPASVEIPHDLDSVALGCVEESATRDVLSMFADEARSVASRPSVSVAPEPPPAAKPESPAAPEPPPAAFEPPPTAPEPPPAAPDDDSVTADDPPPPVETGASTAVPVSGFAEKSSSAEPVADDAETSVGFAGLALEEADATGTGDGETMEMATRVATPEEIEERKRQLEHVNAAHHWRFGFCLVLAVAAIAAVWFAMSNRRHLEGADGPFRPDGEPDVVERVIRNSEGGNDLFFEYPRDPRAKVVQSADSNEFEVATFLGIDRDVPFRISFSRRKDPAELRLSLPESFARWAGGDAVKSVYAFDLKGKPAPEIEFFDAVFGGFCETQTARGLPFVRAQFSHTRGAALWKGFCYRFRFGDVVYSVCNEIPESYWKRGERRLRSSPFFGLFATFLGDQWDSPGEDGLIANFSETELVAQIRHELRSDLVSGWTSLERLIDTLLALTWGKGSANARFARESRDAFLIRKSRFYNERQLAFEIARENHDSKRMKSIFLDCHQVFGQSKRDKRYYLVNDPEVWKCQ